MRYARPLIVMLLLSLLLLAAPVYAEETAPAAGQTETAAEEAPPGLSTLVLLLGLGAVALVGGVALARESFRGQPED